MDGRELPVAEQRIVGDIEVVERDGPVKYQYAMLITFTSPAELRDAINKGGVQIVWR
jgi:hypothetical protein